MGPAGKSTVQRKAGQQEGKAAPPERSYFKAKKQAQWPQRKVLCPYLQDSVYLDCRKSLWSLLLACPALSVWKGSEDSAKAGPSRKRRHRRKTYV